MIGHYPTLYMASQYRGPLEVDEIEVAGNVLTNSSRLGTEVLVEIASSKGQDHLLAISGRASLPAAVTRTTNKRSALSRTA